MATEFTLWIEMDVSHTQWGFHTVCGFLSEVQRQNILVTETFMQSKHHEGSVTGITELTASYFTNHAENTCTAM